jgi:ubiquinone/menaquinone biosynthesis C-methylase UbiE
MKKIPRLKLLPVSEYVGVNRADPIRFYGLPVIGSLYRRRVELCLAELQGGERILEVGFGSGVTFLNLQEQYAEIHGIDLTADVAPIGAFFAQKGLKTFLRNGSLLDLPYTDETFDAVLLISILEHLQPTDQQQAFAEIYRVLKPGGQVVYGVPVERGLMVFLFRVLGYNIRQHHFSTEKDVYQAASRVLQPIQLRSLTGFGGLMGSLYEVAHLCKA